VVDAFAVLLALLEFDFLFDFVLPADVLLVEGLYFFLVDALFSLYFEVGAEGALFYLHIFVLLAPVLEQPFPSFPERLVLTNGCAYLLVESTEDAIVRILVGCLSVPDGRGHPFSSRNALE
jgi:hypothetical protein